MLFIRLMSSVALFAAISASDGSVAARAATVTITIESIAFAEVKDPLHVGDTIVWVNKDVVAHTATAKNGDWRVVIPPNAKATLVMKKAGTVDYYCEYHPNMIGRLVILAKKGT